MECEAAAFRGSWSTRFAKAASFVDRDSQNRALLNKTKMSSSVIKCLCPKQNAAYVANWDTKRFWEMLGHEGSIWFSLWIWKSAFFLATFEEVFELELSCCVQCDVISPQIQPSNDAVPEMGHSCMSTTQLLFACLAPLPLGLTSEAHIFITVPQFITIYVHKQYSWGNWKAVAKICTWEKLMIFYFYVLFSFMCRPYPESTFSFQWNEPTPGWRNTLCEWAHWVFNCELCIKMFKGSPFTVRLAVVSALPVWHE